MSLSGATKGNSSMSPQKTVLVTVGTTKFEDLVRAVDTQPFANALRDQGYENLLIQKGSGVYAPQTLVPAGKNTNKLPNGLFIEFFDFKPNLADYISSADLVISHAGSGSIFESLSVNTPLIVVPNPKLMDNHQAELGGHLAAMKHLVCTTPDSLVEAVKAFDASTLKPYSKGSAVGIAKAIDQVMGFTD